ncbi:MAG TPA: efflux RND transporter periplasmic adaptor subunit [Stellaceae bacterium]|nr:efflux RND transporter periplasmic adaptor subunit [Stellaceae bacterium]
MKRGVMAVAIVALLAGGGAAYRALRIEQANSQTLPAPHAAPAVPVVVVPAERQTVAVTLGAIGTAQPIASLAVKSRIDAQIAEVKVKDGQYVKAGDVLFLLDSRAAEAQVLQAQAQLARDKAQLVNANRDVGRYAPLVKKDFVSHQQYDTAVTTAQALEAGVQADEAALQNAKVQLSYYTITAPIDGRLGMVMAKVGNDVKANDVPFLTLNQVKPIYVNFSVAERALPAIRAAMAAGPVKVEARPAGDKGAPAVGKLAFFDNTVDATTGTIALRAVFDNQDERLWPGQFANVSLILGDDANALTVPQAAVQIGQGSSFVFVVRPDNTAEARKVTVSRTVDGKSVIASGLQAGERVVVDGQLRLVNGSRVEIRSASPGKNS